MPAETDRGEYLLEVRTEEIPARMVAGAAQELATRLFEELMAHGLGPSEVESGFTPRRLIVVLRGLPAKESDHTQAVIGPARSVAFDAAGNPTAAASGFAKRLGIDVAHVGWRRFSPHVDPNDVVAQEPAVTMTVIGQPVPKPVKVKVQGEYAYVKLRSQGRSTPAVIAEVTPRILRALSWAKTMRWGSGEEHGPWVRPVHGIVSLLDGEVVPFSLFGVAAGNETAGHPVLSPESFAVAGAEDHRAQLAARGIEVRPAERRRRLLDEMRQRAAARGGRLVEDGELLDKLAAVCEIPGVMEGDFGAEFLALPREVLVTSLRDHQSALTAEDPSGGGLLPAFFTVMDRPDDPQGRIRAGNEWVVAARLADARFFYDEDRRLPLAERARRLDHLTFHERLGSYADKTERLVALAELLAKELGWAGASGAAAAAARLLKADLTTDMVREFTSLQGIMGGVYARLEGYPEEIWQAIYDQYLPAGTADPTPRGRAGQVTALADRIDTLAGCFGIGLVPTGSRDPFGLRRAAQGVVRIVLEGGLTCDLDLAVAAAARLYGDRLARSPEQILADLRPFLYDRVRYLLELQGFAYDEIESALAVGGGNLPDLRARVEALHRVREEPTFLAIVLAAKRIANIIRDAPEHELEPRRLTEPAERALHAALDELRAEIEDAAARRDYERCLRRIEDLAGVLDRFFVEVLVMDEDPAVRRNRLALLQSIHRVLSRAARLTEMVVDRAEHRARTAEAAGGGGS